MKINGYNEKKKTCLCDTSEAIITVSGRRQWKAPEGGTRPRMEVEIEAEGRWQRSGRQDC